MINLRNGNEQNEAFQRRNMKEGGMKCEDFRRVRKIAISGYASSCPPILPSVRMRKLGSQTADFHEILHLSISRKSAEKIQALLKYDTNKWYFT